VPVRGRVIKTNLAGGRGDIPDLQMTVELTNEGRVACRVLSYRVEWGGRGVFSAPLLSGSKECRPASLRVAAGSTAQDNCTVESHGPLDGHGAIDSSARVVAVLGSCAP
jgi:hypothetical protein